MLVLTRKQEEKICIGDEIVITLLRVKGKSIRLGIEAPDKVCVLRGELVFDAPADKTTASNSGNSNDAIRKQAGSRGKKNAEQVAAADTPLPQANVCHAQISRERCQQVIASLQSDRGPLGALMENRASTL